MEEEKKTYVGSFAWGSCQTCQLKNSMDKEVTVLWMILWAYEDGSQNFESRVLCKTDQIGFSMSSFLKFSLDWEKQKVLQRQFSQIFFCSNMPTQKFVG